MLCRTTNENDLEGYECSLPLNHEGNHKSGPLEWEQTDRDLELGKANQYDDLFLRECQSCWHLQKDVCPYPNNPTRAFQDRKCRKCKSEDLDYGTTNRGKQFEEQLTKR